MGECSIGGGGSLICLDLPLKMEMRRNNLFSHGVVRNGMVSVWNSLPQRAVGVGTLNTFKGVENKEQRKLQHRNRPFGHPSLHRPCYPSELKPSTLPESISLYSHPVHVFVKCLLKVTIVSASTTSPGNEFQAPTTLCVKKTCLVHHL